MQAVILAAGMGSRLKQLTAEHTKCMIQVNGVTLIERMLRQLEALPIRRVILVVGYGAKALIGFVQSLDLHLEIHFVENVDYAKTNNIYSLALSRDFLLEDDSLILESDLIFETALLEGLLSDPRPNLALVDRLESWMDGTVVRLNADDSIEAFIPREQIHFAERDQYFKTCNIYKFSRDFLRQVYWPYLEAYMKSNGVNQYYEQVLRIISQLDRKLFEARRLQGECWYEIDDAQDLDIAETLFAETAEERMDRVMQRYGGYWRYPELLDFCYLVNPYYPPKQMIEEIKASFTELLHSYPSGQKVNAGLIAKTFGVFPDQIVVGNGAAELISAYFRGTAARRSDGRPKRVGILRPSFEEYSARLGEREEVVFYPDDFQLRLDDLAQFVRSADLDELVLINPDNPSGSYLPLEEVLALAELCAERGVRLLLDESFADFAESVEPYRTAAITGNTALTEDILNQYPNLVILKSISKSFGVPGLRLGYLASGNRELIRTLQREVSIWNINSFAEFYLQIQEKYQKAYRKALADFRTVRAELVEGLSRYACFKLYPSQANYLMLELVPSPDSPFVSARELAVELFRRNILVKDLTPKMWKIPGLKGRHFLRIAVRDRESHAALLTALSDLMTC